MIFVLLSLGVTLGLTARGTKAAECLEPASRVVSRWKNGNYYKGEIESITNRVNVLFDNGARLAYSPQDNVDIVVDRIPDNTEIPWGSQIIVNRPRSLAFEIGYIRDIRNGRFAVLYENGDTIYHTLDEIRAFNKSRVCDEPAYLGCYRDNLPRNLEVYIATQPATIGACVDTCKSQGFSIGALRNSDLCFCGNSYNKSYQVTDKECDIPCYDNSFEICGGFMTFSQYWTGIVNSEAVMRPGIQKHFIPSNRPIPWELLMHSRSNRPLHSAGGSMQNGAWYLAQPPRRSQWQSHPQAKPGYPENPYRSYYQQYGARPSAVNYNRYQLNGQSQRYNYDTAATNYEETTRQPSLYNYQYNRNYNYKLSGANRPNSVYNAFYQRRPATRPSPQELAKLMSLLKKVKWGLYREMLPASTPAPTPFRYLGCFQDSSSRDLQTAVDVKPLTIEGCVSQCRRAGFSVAGVQLSVQCYCGNTYSRYGRLRNDHCTMRCSGNYNEICGGQMMNSLFYTGVGQAVPYNEKYGTRNQDITFKKNIPRRYHPKHTMKYPTITYTVSTMKIKSQVTKDKYPTAKHQSRKTAHQSNQKSKKTHPEGDYGQLKNILQMLSKWQQKPHKVIKNKTTKSVPNYSDLRKILEDMTPDIVKKIANKIIAEDANKTLLNAKKPLADVKSLEVNLASTTQTPNLDPGLKRLIKVKSTGYKNWSKNINYKNKAKKRHKRVRPHSSPDLALEADAKKLPSTSILISVDPFKGNNGKHGDSIGIKEFKVTKTNGSNSARKESTSYASLTVSNVRGVKSKSVPGLPSFIPIADKEKKHRVTNQNLSKPSYLLHEHNAIERLSTASKNFVMSDLHLQSNKRNFVHLVVTKSGVKRSKIPGTTNRASPKNTSEKNATRILHNDIQPKSHANSSVRDEKWTREKTKENVSHPNTSKHVAINASQQVSYTAEANETHPQPSNTSNDAAMNASQNVSCTTEVNKTQPNFSNTSKHVAINSKHLPYVVEAGKTKQKLSNHKHIKHKVKSSKRKIQQPLRTEPLTHQTEGKHRTETRKVLHVEANWNGHIRVKANWRDEIEPAFKTEKRPATRKDKIKLPKKITQKFGIFSEEGDGGEGESFDDSGSRNELIWNKGRTHIKLLHPK